jgi:hypothetical protein
MLNKYGLTDFQRLIDAGLIYTYNAYDVLTYTIRKDKGVYKLERIPDPSIEIDPTECDPPEEFKRCDQAVMAFLVSIGRLVERKDTPRRHLTIVQ